MGINSDNLIELLMIKRMRIKKDSMINIPDKIYSESIDSLIPVWEKIGEAPRITLKGTTVVDATGNTKILDKHKADFFLLRYIEGLGDTPQEAAAIATAHVITLLKDIENENT